MGKLLIWDIDGTLLTVNRAGRAAMDMTFKEVFDIDRAFDLVNMSGRLDGVILREALQVHALDIEDIEALETAFYARYKGILENLLSTSFEGVLYPGIRKILDLTHGDHDIINMIGTGNCKVGAIAKLSSQRIQNYFEIGAYGDEYHDRGDLIKGAIDKAQKRYAIDFDDEDIFVIGDTVHDINAAKAAGVKSVVVLTGSDDYAKVVEANPDYIFKDFENHHDFLDILI